MTSANDYVKCISDFLLLFLLAIKLFNHRFPTATSELVKVIFLLVWSNNCEAEIGYLSFFF